MTAQHFKEILESICKSTHSTKRTLANHLCISEVSLWRYENQGVPDSKKYLVMSRLKEYLFTNLGGKENATYHEKRN